MSMKILMVMMMRLMMMLLMNDHLKWIDPRLHLTKPPPQTPHLPNIRHHHDEEGHSDDHDNNDHDHNDHDHNHDDKEKKMTSSSISEYMSGIASGSRTFPRSWLNANIIMSMKIRRW